MAAGLWDFLMLTQHHAQPHQGTGSGGKPHAWPRETGPSHCLQPGSFPRERGREIGHESPVSPLKLL